MKKNNVWDSLTMGVVLVRKLDGKKLLTMALKTLAGAVVTLVPMFLSAIVVEMLGNNMEAEKMVMLTVGNLTAVFLICAVYAWLEKKNELETESCIQEYLSLIHI